jgi:hypothetical protein
MNRQKMCEGDDLMPAATQHYAKITPTKLAKSYADASYFARNLRAIEVLVDQRVIRSGRAATEPWKLYDLGHGYRLGQGLGRNRFV